MLSHHGVWRLPALDELGSYERVIRDGHLQGCVMERPIKPRVISKLTGLITIGGV